MFKANSAILNALLTLLNDILDISRVEAGKVALENLPFEPATVLAEVERLFRELDAVAKPGAILATNTSGLDINEIAAVTSRPLRPPNGPFLARPIGRWFCTP